MSVNIVSTDSEADIQAALGNKPVEKVDKPQVKPEETKSASADKVDETPSESETEEKPVEVKAEDGEPRPKKSNLERRFSKLTKRQAEQAREIENLRAENAALRVSKPAAEPAQSKTSSSKEPDPADYETHSAFVKAMVKFEADQREVVQSQKTKETELRSEMAKDETSYRQKLTEFMKVKPDFQDRLDDVGEISISNVVKDRLMKAGPEIVYAMMEDPSEFKRICSLNPLDALEEIGEFKARTKAVAKLQITETPDVKTKPKPPTPVGSKVTPTKDWEKMTMKEYDQWRRAGNSPRG